MQNIKAMEEKFKIMMTPASTQQYIPNPYTQQYNNNKMWFLSGDGYLQPKNEC